MDRVKQIAVVSPDKGLRDSLRFVLGAEGYGVKAAGRWTEVQEELARYLCIIIDERSLYRDRILASKISNASVPVIILTDEIEPLAAPHQYTVPKPLQGRDLFAMIEALTVIP